MQRALDLAARGLGRVEPNPMVGAVVVRGGEVVGEGFHARFGGPHAEVVALDAAGDAARGADLYVTLEPCCHHGKTPPCTQAVLHAGIRRVVAAVTDPFPEVGGRGLARLREAGVAVEVGLMEAEARRLNAAFFKRVLTGLPLVIAKWAMTLDGRLAAGSGRSRWISSEAGRRRVHEVRAVCDAVIVGAGTVAADAPSLTVRLAPLPEVRPQPARVLLDDALVTDPARPPASTVADAPVLVYTSPAALEREAARADALRRAGCEVIESAEAEGGLDLRAVLQDLARRGMSRVLLEGGSRVFGAFFAARLVDRVMVFVAPKVLGSANAISPVAGPAGLELETALALEDMTATPIGPDVLIEGRASDY
jgi:diaminohydroxyphosphoribosylaminopyrimidine deaminase/5-amino-6-(5-phosphoribosylamino)uracil reductase